MIILIIYTHVQECSFTHLMSTLRYQPISVFMNESISNVTGFYPKFCYGNQRQKESATSIYCIEQLHYKIS